MRFDVTRIFCNARAGVLETAHGQVETPCFMPVGTYGAVRGIHPERLEALGARILLANAYHLYLSPGMEVVRSCGGIQRFMGFEGPVLTDSGGYQIFSLRAYSKVVDEGVHFRSPIDGSGHFFTPEQMVSFQADLGVDVAMMLDQVPPSDAPREEVEEAAQRTSLWAARALSVPRSPDTALFGIVQGGLIMDLRIRCLEEMADKPFDGLALGGFSVGEPPEKMHELVSALAPRMPIGKPRYLMGVGRPADLVRAVASGIDLFDCVMPTRHARNGQMFTRFGPVNIANARYRTDPDPVEEGCTCPTCRRFSRAYLSHLYRRKELLYNELATTHNLHHYLSLMRSLRSAILNGNLGETAGVLLAGYEAEGGAHQ